MKTSDIDELKYAKELLENQGIAIRLTNFLGYPVEKSFKLLPAGWSERVHNITNASMRKALDFAVLTMDDNPQSSSSDFFHKIIAGTAGAAGGLFGLPGISVELPVSTIIILRSIADIARSEGERISGLEEKLECLKIFAFSGHSALNDTSDTGYFAIRTAIARTVSEAADILRREVWFRKVRLRLSA